MRIDTYTVGIGSVLKFKPYNKELIKNNYFFKGENWTWLIDLDMFKFIINFVIFFK